MKRLQIGPHQPTGPENFLHPEGRRRTDQPNAFAPLPAAPGLEGAPQGGSLVWGKAAQSGGAGHLRRWGRGVCPQDNDSIEGSVPGSWEKQTSHSVREGCRLVRVPTEVLPPR